MTEPNKRVLGLSPMVGGRGLGPLLRCLSVAKRARDVDFSCCFFAERKFKQQILDAGFVFFEAASPSKNASSKSSLDIWTGICSRLGLLDQDFLNEQFERETNFLLDNFVDFVFMESNITMPVSCISNNVSFSSTISFADLNNLKLLSRKLDYTIKPEEMSAYNKYIEEINLSPVRDVTSLILSKSKFLIAPSTKELSPELSCLKEGGKIKYVGRLLDQDFENQFNTKLNLKREQRSLKIYAYLKTMDGLLPKYISVFRQLADADIKFVVLADSEAFTDENIVVESFGPGRRLIDWADLVIHPGTANTMLQAWALGKYQILVPEQDSERTHNAEKIAAIGGGQVISGSNEVLLKQVILDFKNKKPFLPPYPIGSAEEGPVRVVAEILKHVG